mgnify:CR=1 FL=1
MKIHKYTDHELQLTAILYATREDVVKHVTAKRKLPVKIPLGGFPTAMNFLLRRRGLNSPLSESETAMYEAITRDKLLPGGGVLSYPFGQSQTPDGRVLEGNGVVPDVEVGLDRDLLLQGIDSQLAAAMEYAVGRIR